jgi:hypothetical protein
MIGRADDMQFLFLVFLLFLIILALREKVKTLTDASLSGGLPEEMKSSPFSRALTELIATAGGIYLSLLMLTTFLDLNIPQKISLKIIEIDTIAGIALLIAIVQPFILNLKYKFLKR